VAVGPLPRAIESARAPVATAFRAHLGATLLGLALPFVFLHVDHQPSVSAQVGSTSVDLDLSDFAILAVGVAALVSGVRQGFSPLRSGLRIWIAGGAFLVWALASTLYPLARSGDYAWRVHLVSVGKYGEYAILALAVPLLVRSREALVPLVAAVVGWSVVASVVGVCQFLGWSIAGPWPAGRRQPSFLGHEDFAALSGMSLAVALTGIAVGGLAPAVVTVAAASAVVGLVVSGSSAGALGMALAVVAAAVVARVRHRLTLRRVGALVAVAAVTAAGVLALRGNDFDQFLRFLGVRPEERTTTANVQTYAHRTLLAYLGLRIFLGHPVVGVGWQGSSEPSAYGPYLADAHRRFPDTSPIAFPSPERPYGVQNIYVQTLADLGVVGALLLLAFLATVLLRAARASLRGPPDAAEPALGGGLVLVSVLAVLAAVGLVAGVPVDAALWLAVGLVASPLTQGRNYDPAA
jgi:O-antigen ligase